MPRGHCPGDGADPVDQGARDRTGPTGYVLNRPRAGQRPFGVSLLHLRIPDRRATTPVRWGRPALLSNSPWSAVEVSLREGDSEAPSSALKAEHLLCDTSPRASGPRVEVTDGLFG